MLEIDYKSTNTVFEKKIRFLLIRHWKLCTNYDRASILSNNRYLASTELFLYAFSTGVSQQMGICQKVKSWFPYVELKSINSGIKKGKLFIMSYCIQIYNPIFKELIFGPLLERNNSYNYREEVEMKVIVND